MNLALLLDREHTTVADDLISTLSRGSSYSTHAPYVRSVSESPSQAR